MYSVTSTYKRVDGTRARNYVCSHVKNGTGLCNAPSVPAQRVDGYVLEHLLLLHRCRRTLAARARLRPPGAEAAAERALADAEATRDALAAGVTRLAARYARQQDLDTPRAEALSL